MKLNRRTFAFLMVGVLSLCTANVFGGVRPLPPGARPLAGYGWCPRCEGRCYVPSGFLGWTSKPCPNCHATGMIRVVPPPPPPPPPKPVVYPKHHHHPAPAVHHQPKPQPHHTAHPQPAAHHQAPPQPQPQRYQKTPPRR